MKPNFFVLCLLLPLGMLGQSVTPSFSRRVTLGLCFSPTLTNRHVRAGTAEPTENQLVANRNAAERPGWGYDAGLLIQVPLTPRLGVESGLGLSSQLYQTQPVSLSWTEVNPAFPRSSITRSRYNFLSIPLRASYTVGWGRWQGVISGGLLVKLFISQQTIVLIQFATAESRSTSVKFVGVSRILLSPVLSAGLQYAVSPAIHLRLTPTVQYALTSLRPGSSYREHLYGSGLQLSLLKQL
ncbi:hypothetical protein [Spirosoma endbachense]|uniref:Outer membrane beta-barrel protein n=1 Tax=Spirosoma endbachense TaxID=2666025 RepID=A0A6P1W2H6_9BACT|nr:hypothetical protein [Spirosoma endbachense]QHV99094.1 hypothetical protein GJR95_30605 [Spirosoma endbachense]